MIDIVACLDSLGIDMKRSGKNVARNDVNVDCPWCGADKHLGIHRQTGLLNCWVCNLEDHDRYPSFAGLIMEIEEIGYADAKHIIQQFMTDDEAETELWSRPRFAQSPTSWMANKGLPAVRASTLPARAVSRRSRPRTSR